MTNPRQNTQTVRQAQATTLVAPSMATNTSQNMTLAAPSFVTEAQVLANQAEQAALASAQVAEAKASADQAAPTAATMRIGRDTETREGATRGIFAGFLQGSTPKYAFNSTQTRHGEGRSDLFRETLARLFIPVPAAEWELYKSSIADPNAVRPALRLSGKVDPAAHSAPTQATGRDRDDGGTGYLDFFIQQAQIGLNEKFSVSETLADNYVAYFMGQAPPVWSFSGWLMNTVQDDQATNFMRLYLEILRGTKLAQRQKVVSLRIDSYIITGAMVGLNMNLLAASEIYVPFAFQLLVKKVVILNFNSGWQPLSAATPFSNDLNLLAYDRRVVLDQARQAIAARLPAGTSFVTDSTVDARANDLAAANTPLLPADAVGLATPAPGASRGNVTPVAPPVTPNAAPPAPEAPPVSTSPMTPQPETLPMTPAVSS